MDRNLSAEEVGYSTILLKMRPLQCSPKNDIIIGYLPSHAFRSQICVDPQMREFTAKALLMKEDKRPSS